MHRFRRVICTVLTLAAVAQTALFPACAEETAVVEDPAALQYTETVPEATEAVAEETEYTVPVETESEETEPEETEPEETEPEETEEVPAETTSESLFFREVLPAEGEQLFEEVPLYFQTDYPDVRYGSGSIKSSGCSITCLAMVASYLTDHEYLPDELARYFGGQAENNMARMEYGADAMLLPYEKNCNFHKSLEALQEGKIVIALMNGNSIFTESQHFIVLRAMNEDGTIMVHDPYAPNYDRWDLKRAFAEGFDEGDISCGYEGGWVFDPAAMPEEPFLYEEKLRDYTDSRYTGLRLTYEEQNLIARVVWAEARGESFEGQQAVAEVVLNRLVSGDFSDSLMGVIYGENQFRSVPYLEDAEPSQAQYEAVEAALYGPNILPMEVVHFATYKVTENVWGQIDHHYFCYPA